MTPRTVAARLLYSAGGKEPPANAGDIRDAGSILGWEEPLEEGMAPLQYPCLENPMDRGAWRATVHGVAKSRTRLSAHAQSCRWKGL